MYTFIINNKHLEDTAIWHISAQYLGYSEEYSENQTWSHIQIQICKGLHQIAISFFQNLLPHIILFSRPQQLAEGVYIFICGQCTNL